MLSHEELKKKALMRAGVRAEYERLEKEEFALLDLMLTARREANLTQAEIAERMGTKQPAVTRMETALASGKHSPSLTTIRKYFAACGKRLVLQVTSL